MHNHTTEQSESEIDLTKTTIGERTNERKHNLYYDRNIKIKDNRNESL